MPEADTSCSNNCSECSLSCAGPNVIQNLEPYLDEIQTPKISFNYIRIGGITNLSKD